MIDKKLSEEHLNKLKSYSFSWLLGIAFLLLMFLTQAPWSMAFGCISNVFQLDAEIFKFPWKHSELSTIKKLRRIVVIALAAVAYLIFMGMFIYYVKKCGWSYDPTCN